MNKIIISIALLFSLFGAGCKKDDASITDSGRDEEILPEEKSEFIVSIISPDSGSLYYKSNQIRFEIEARDSVGTLMKIDSMQWSSGKDGIFFRWKNDMGILVFPTLTTIYLSVGEHILTATLYSKEKVGFKKINVTIVDTVYVKTTFENQHWSVYYIPAELVYEMESDLQGSVFIGTHGTGMIIRKNEQWISYTAENSPLLSNYIQSIAVDHDNNIYVGHWGVGGINKFNGTGWSTIPSHDTSQFAVADVHSIAFDKNNTLWAALHKGEIYSYDSNWHEVTRDSTLFPHPGKIMFDTQGNLWGNAEHNYPFKYDGATWQLFNTIPRCYEMIIDKNDNVWFGTGNNGIYRIEGTAIVNYTEENSGLPTDKITALAIDKDDQYWIGTSEGLVNYNGVAWTFFNTDNSDLPDNYITCLAVDNQNNIWIGMQNNIAVYKK